MAAFITKQLEKLGKTDEDVEVWAKDNGYGTLLPNNLELVRQIYLDAHDVELEYPDLEMRGRRVLVTEIPNEEWVILRVFMHKIARTTTYPMCPEEGCYSKVANGDCTNKKDPHGYVAEPVQGIRHYYKAGDESGSVYIIVPAKYAMNGYVFEHMWCDVKGIWNEKLEGFFSNLILPVNGDEPQSGSVIVPKPISTSKAEEEEEETSVNLPKGLDVTMFATKSKPKEEQALTDEEVKFRAELANFQQIIPFFSGHLVSQFDTFIQSNKIQTPIDKLVEATPNCHFEGEGEQRRIIYKEP
jgi:hypothetical protein